MPSSSERREAARQQAFDQHQAVYDRDGVRLTVKDGDSPAKVRRRDEPVNSLTRKAEGVLRED